MYSRRHFLTTISAGLGTSLAGCDWWEDETARPVDLPDGALDIHAHVFNGSDVPVAGFLDQVFLRSPETPVDGSYSPNALVRLIAEVLTSGVMTAAAELRELPGAGPLPQTAEDVLLAQDKQAVAAGVRRYEASVAGRVSIAGESRAAVEDRALLGELSQLSGRGPAILTDARDLGTAVADAIFDPGAMTMMSQMIRSADFSLGQTLRWAALLTRKRRDILGEFVRLYGPRETADGTLTGVRAISPSLVDFEYWFKAAPQKLKFSPIEDQMALMSRVALLEKRVVLLNFAPFCPLRAIRERQVNNRDWHRVLQNAIETQGFVGIKLYPPMGFKPWGNGSTPEMGQRFKASGAAVEAELRRLYRWCARMGVPIKAHGNNSLAADECSGQNAAPDLWAPVLRAHPDLRVNIAHFGGFEEDTPTDKCTDPPTYEERAARLISDQNRAYVDLGYWTEVAGKNRPGGGIVERVDALLARNPVLGDRIMYGSDYSMIGREQGHGRYLADVENAVGRLGNATRQKVFTGNAFSYLGLDDPKSKTRSRLEKFFPSDHPYFDLV